jgi:ABC-type multidrug transport system fused ATPase/permease subunit
VAIARAVLKRPDILVLNGATAVLDESSQQALVTALRDEFAGRRLIWNVHRARHAQAFDRVFVFSGGRLAATGTFDALADKDDTLRALLTQE